MIQIAVNCNRLKQPIDLTWDRKRGVALTVPIEAIMP